MVYLMMTVDPGRAYLGTCTTSQLVILMHPDDVARPMVRGLLVPWMPIPDLVSPSQSTPTGLLGPAGMSRYSLLRTPVFRSDLS